MGHAAGVVSGPWSQLRLTDWRGGKGTHRHGGGPAWVRSPVLVSLVFSEPRVPQMKRETDRRTYASQWELRINTTFGSN